MEALQAPSSDNEEEYEGSGGTKRTQEEMSEEEEGAGQDGFADAMSKILGQTVKAKVCPLHSFG